VGHLDDDHAGDGGGGGDSPRRPPVVATGPAPKTRDGADDGVAGVVEAQGVGPSRSDTRNRRCWGCPDLDAGPRGPATRLTCSGDRAGRCRVLGAGATGDRGCGREACGARLGAADGPRLTRSLRRVRHAAAQRDVSCGIGRGRPAGRGDEVLGSVARDLARAADAGTATGALLARHAEAARSAAHAAALARAKAVGVQTIIPVSVCYLPAFFLLGVVPVIAGVLASLLP